MKAILENPVHTPTVEQFQGCLLGGAVGDAVGALVETRSPAECRVYDLKVLSLCDWDRLTSLTYMDRSPGQYTDDTQLSIVLAEELCAYLNEDTEDAWDPHSFAKSMSEADLVGSGGTTRKAMGKIMSGVPWTESGSPDATSNGSAMRAAPSGMAFFTDWPTLKQVAQDQSIPTHSHNTAVSASVVMAMATSMSLTAGRGTTNPREKGWWNWLAMHAGMLPDTQFSSLIRDLTRKHFDEKTSPIEIQRWLIHEVDNGGWSDKNGGVSPSAVSSVMAAFYSFMFKPTEYWEAIQFAVSFGGDTDTIASLTGNLSGAYNGKGSIPERLREWVHDCSAKDGEYLNDLGERLHTLALARRDRLASAAEIK